MVMVLPGMEPSLQPVQADGAAGDEWYTPKFILDWMGTIALDPCWSHSSLVAATAVLDLRRGQDGLTWEWQPGPEGLIFVNPPFSNTSAWLRRCRLEAARLGRVVVALVPAFPGDAPWHVEVWPGAVSVGWISGRLEFVNPVGRVETKGRGHGLVVYGPEDLALAAVREIALRSQHHAQAPVWTRRFFALAEEKLPQSA